MYSALNEDLVLQYQRDQAAQMRLARYAAASRGNRRPRWGRPLRRR